MLRLFDFLLPVTLSLSLRCTHFRAFFPSDSPTVAYPPVSEICLTTRKLTQSRPRLSVASDGNESQPYATIGTPSSYACYSFVPHSATTHFGMGDYSYHSLANMGPQGRWRRPLLIAIPVVLLFIIYSSSFSYTPSSASQTQIQ